jgi:hypothetical protein
VLAAGVSPVAIGAETPQSPAEIFGPGLRSIRCWDAALQRYATPTALRPGLAYWVDMRAPATITVTGTVVPTPFLQPTPRGWNQLGNPFHVATPLKQVFAVRGGTSVTLQAAATAGWLTDVQQWNGRTWVRADLRTGQLVPGQPWRLRLLLDGVQLDFRRTREWTMMLYLNGDDAAINGDMLAMFSELIGAGVGSSEDVNIVVQFDRYFEPGNDFGAWPITHRFYYTPGMEPTPENAFADWGGGHGGGREVGMDEPETLRDFIQWAAPQWPARRTMLLMVSHGFGWQGI